MPRDDGHELLYRALGERIRRARGGLSQAKLAHKVGVSRASIVNIESGRQRPPIHLLWQIAEALDVEASRLIPLRGELAEHVAPVQLRPEVVAYIEEQAQNDPAVRRQLTDFIQRATAQIDTRDGTTDATPSSAPGRAHS